LSRGTPPVLTRLLRRLHVVYDTMILLTVQIEHVPAVDDAARVTIERASHGLVRVVARYGFDEQPNVPAIIARVLPEIAPDTAPESVLYVLGRETVVPGPGGKMAALWEHSFAWLAGNARPATAYFAIPPGQVIELGIQVDL
jgi:KUP system potassium uptake protein